MEAIPVTLNDPVGIAGLLPGHGDRGVGDGVGGHVEGGGGHPLVCHHHHCGGGTQALRVPDLLLFCIIIFIRKLIICNSNAEAKKEF